MFWGIFLVIFCHISICNVIAIAYSCQDLNMDWEHVTDIHDCDWTIMAMFIMSTPRLSPKSLVQRQQKGDQCQRFYTRYSVFFSFWGIFEHFNDTCYTLNSDMPIISRIKLAFSRVLVFPDLVFLSQDCTSSVRTRRIRFVFRKALQKVKFCTHFISK